MPGSQLEAYSDFNDSGAVLLTSTAVSGIVKSTAMMSINSGLYGLHMAVAVVALYFTAKGSKALSYSRRYLAFIGVLLLLATINFGLAIPYSALAQSAVLRDPQFRAETLKRQSSVMPALISMSFLITIMCHSLMVYRCYIIWNQSKRVLVFSVLVFLAAMGLGLFSSFGYNPNLESGIYTPALLFLNLTLTLLICSRILWCRMKIRKLLGEEFKLRGWDRDGVVSIIIESSLIHTIISVFAIAIDFSPFGKCVSDRVSFSLLTQVECIASELIILRVAVGRAFKQEWATMAVEGTVPNDPEGNRRVTLAPIQFAHSTGAGTTYSNDLESASGS